MPIQFPPKTATTIDRRRAVFDKDEVTLVLAWLEGRIPITDFISRSGTTTMNSAYSFLATRLKLAFEHGLLVRKNPTK